MSVDLAGISGVQARVAQIQSQLDSLSGVNGTSTTQTNSTSSTNGQTFEQLLSQASTGNSALSSLTTSGTTATSTPGVLPTGAGAVGADALITAAKKYLGVPYKWGGTDPAVGLDCSGFVQRAFKDMGISLPRVAADQARMGTKVDSIAQAKPGDLVAFGSPVDHIGIYVGDNKMIVAPRTGDVVKIQTLYRTPTAIRRVLPDEVAGLPTAAGQSLALPGSASGTLAEAPSQYQALFAKAQSTYGVSANLLAAVAKAESGFNPSAVSPAGARGLMQIMPGTARGLGVNPNDPAQAVDGAARLLRDNLRKFGSTELALAAYNAGPGAVSKYGGVPPYAQTRSYVRKIMADPGVAAA